jgi:hypothetical protein
MDEAKIEAIKKAMDTFMNINSEDISGTIIHLNIVLSKLYEDGFEAGFRKKVKVA